MARPDAAHRYAIRGGNEGKERLDVLARVLLPTTAQLLDRVGLITGMKCLDVGCGGGLKRNPHRKTQRTQPKQIIL